MTSRLHATILCPACERKLKVKGERGTTVQAVCKCGQETTFTFPMQTEQEQRQAAAWKREEAARAARAQERKEAKADRARQRELDNAAQIQEREETARIRAQVIQKRAAAKAEGLDLCLQCHTRTTATSQTNVKNGAVAPGGCLDVLMLLMELSLWIGALFTLGATLIIAIPWSIARLILRKQTKTKHQVCEACGAKDQFVPYNSPRARKILG